MCGNFGLLALGIGSAIPGSCCGCFGRNSAVIPSNSSAYDVEYGDRTIDGENEELIPIVKILEAQTASTEIRGGQAGGFSSIEYKMVSCSPVDPLFGTSILARPESHRVRMVARKRHPLAADLSALYMKERKGRSPDPNATITGNQALHFFIPLDLEPSPFLVTIC
jgi:hypothetical protein